MIQTVVRSSMIKKENKGVFMDYDVYVACCSDDNCECDPGGLCDECDKIPSSFDYKDGSYCTWYCAKKGSK